MLRFWRWSSHGEALADTSTDYLWDPADPRSFQALREGGGRVPAMRLARDAVAAQEPAASSDGLESLATADGGSLEWLGRRRVALPLAAVLGGVVALVILSAVGVLDSDRGSAPEVAATTTDSATEEIADVAETSDPVEAAAAVPPAPAPIPLTPADEQYLAVVREASEAVRLQVEAFEAALPAADALTTDRYFAAFVESSRGTLRAGYDGLAAVTPPGRFVADHHAMLEYYAIAVAYNETAWLAAARSDRLRFRTATLDLQRLGNISAASLSEEACIAFAGPRPFCWRANALEGGAYGTHINRVIRELAAPRWVFEALWSLPDATIEEDTIVAAQELDARFADLARARVAAQALRPSAEFEAEHEALLEILELLAVHMWIEENAAGAPVVTTRWAAAQGICQQFRNFPAPFRAIAPLEVLIPDQVCSGPRR